MSNSDGNSHSETPPESPYSTRTHSMTQSDVLRSRIEEQSQLIMVLKTRNDQLLAKVNAAEGQNRKLIQGQGILKTQLSDDAKRFDRLENHFNTLAANHQEMIDIKDQYKASNELLRFENGQLKEQLRSKDSAKIQALSREIKRLKEALKIETELLQQQSDQNLINQQKLKQNQDQLKELSTKVAQKCAKIEMLEEQLKASSTDTAEKDKLITSLRREQGNLVAANMKRGETLAKLQSEKLDLEVLLEEVRKEVKKLKLKWKNEIDKIDVNYKIKCLLEELDGCRDSISELELHKTTLKRELGAEKLLNSRLRQYK